MKFSSSFFLALAYIFFLPFVADAQISGCQTEVSAIEDCLQMNLSPSTAQRCVDCMTMDFNFPVAIDSCNAAGAAFCQVLEVCPACIDPQCEDQLNAVVTCAAQNVNGLDACTLTCSISASTLSFAWWTIILGVVGVSWMMTLV